MSHRPIDPRNRDSMNMLATAIDRVLNGNENPERFAFAVLVAEFGQIDNCRVNYISNGTLDDMIAMMRELIARAESRYHEGGRA